MKISQSPKKSLFGLFDFWGEMCDRNMFVRVLWDSLNASHCMSITKIHSTSRFPSKNKFKLIRILSRACFTLLLYTWSGETAWLNEAFSLQVIRVFKTFIDMIWKTINMQRSKDLNLTPGGTSTWIYFFSVTFDTFRYII